MMPEQLERMVSEARRRLVAQAVARALAVTLRVGLALAIVVLAADKLWRLRFEPWWMIGAVILLAAVAGVALGWRQRLSKHQAALVLDERLGLGERLSSAVAMQEAGYDGPLLQPMLDDAGKQAAGIDLKTALPRTALSELRLVLALAVILVALTFLPRFSFWRTPSDLAVEMVSRQVGEELTEIAKEVEQKSEGESAPRAREEARKLLREALKLRRARLGKEEALRQLERLNQDLQQEREQLAGKPLRQSGKEESRNLARMGEFGHQVAEQLADPRADAAQQLLEELAKQAQEGKLSKEQGEQAAEELEKLAEALKDSPYSAQSEALGQAADALRKGGSGAADALEKAAEALGEGGSPNQELLEELQEYVQEGKQALGDAEDIYEEAQKNGGQCPDGLCKPGDGKSGQGQGQSGQGQPGSGGINRGPGTTNEGHTGGPADGAQPGPYQPGQSPDDDTPAEYERLYAPRRTETLQGDEQVRGRSSGLGTFRTEAGPREAPGLEGSKVPYYEVLGDYEAEADDAMSRGEIPLTERERVKSYFNELREPAAE